MSDSLAAAGASALPDDWLTTIAAMSRTAAMDFLVAHSGATPATLATLAVASLHAVEENPLLAEEYLQLADALRQLLTSAPQAAMAAIPAAMDAHLAYAAARLWVQRGQLATAEATLRQAQAHWQRANDSGGLARTLLGLTQVLAMQGRYADAESVAHQAVAAFIPDRPAVATDDALVDTSHTAATAAPFSADTPSFAYQLLQVGARHNLATLLLYTERHVAALTEYERALQLLFTIERAALTPVEERSWLSEVAHNELNRASALTFLDRPEEAEAALLRASAYFLQAEERMNHGRAQTNLGRLYLRWGQYANALTAFDQALNDLLGERAAELLVAALTVNVSESDQAMGGEHAPALAQLRQADELLLEQAMAYLAMNLLPEAQQRLAICEVLFRTAVQPYELGQTLYTWGLFDLRAGELSRAATHLAEAALQFAQLSNGFWQNRTALAQAALLYAAGDLNGAVSAVEQLFAAIPSDWAEPTDERLQWDLGGLVELHLLRLRCGIRLGQLTEVPLWAEQIAMLLGFSFVTLQNAATLSDRSVAATTAPVEPVALPHYTQRFYHLLGQWARAEREPLRARYYFQQAIELLERTRALLPVEEIRTAFLDDKGELYADLILLLLEQAEADPTALADAFAAVERARSRALLERLLAAVGNEATGAHTESTADSTAESQATMLRNRLHWLYNQLLGESGSRRLDGRMNAQLLAEEAALQQIEWRQSTLMQQAEPADLPTFQAALDADQQALVYVILNASHSTVAPSNVTTAVDKREVMAFLVDRHSIVPYRHLSTTVHLAPLLDELHFQLGRAELGPDFLARHQARLQARLRSVLAQLYRQLVAPMRPALTGKRLLIVPYGPLHRLPFHALWDGERYLLETMSISYAPSASTVVMRRQRGPRGAVAFDAQRTRWAGLAIEDAAIPAARAEVTGVARCFATAQLYLDAAANRAGLESAAQAEILHVATHGLFRPDNPFFSALKLADGWINVRELYRLPLHTRLVVLSACESGAGVVHGGDEVVGLVRGFLGAGAREVLASLWNVHDATAVDLMRQFYLALTNGSGARPAEALRMAQRWAVAEELHPYYWAPFYVIGE